MLYQLLSNCENVLVVCHVLFFNVQYDIYLTSTDIYLQSETRFLLLAFFLFLTLTEAINTRDLHSMHLTKGSKYHNVILKLTSKCIYVYNMPTYVWLFNRSRSFSLGIDWVKRTTPSGSGQQNWRTLASTPACSGRGFYWNIIVKTWREWGDWEMVLLLLVSLQLKSGELRIWTLLFVLGRNTL